MSLNTREQSDLDGGIEADPQGSPVTEPGGLPAAAENVARSSGEVSGAAFREIVMAQLRDPDAPRAAVYTAAPPVDETEPLPPIVEAAIERYRDLRRLVDEPDVAGALIFAAAAVTFMLIFAPMPGLVGSFGDWVGDTLGLLAVAIPLVIAWWAFLVANERGDELPHGRLAAGGVVVAIFALGALRVWLPARDLWGLDVATVTSGGNLGQWFTTTIPGAIAWLLVGAGAFSILRPAEARRIARTAPPVMRRGVKNAWRDGRRAVVRQVDRSFDGAMRRKRAAVADRLQGDTGPSGKRGSHLTSAMAAKARRGSRSARWSDVDAPAGPEPWDAGAGDTPADAEQSQFRAKRARRRSARSGGSSMDVDASVRQLRIALGQENIDEPGEVEPAPAGGFAARAEAMSAHAEVADSTPGYRQLRRRGSGQRRKRKQAETKRTAATVPALTVLLLILSIGVGIMVRGDLDRGQAQEVSSLAADLGVDDTNASTGTTTPPLFGSQTGPGSVQTPGGGDVPEAGAVRNGGAGVGLYDDCNTATLTDGSLAEGMTVQVIAAGAGVCEGWALVETAGGLATWLPTVLISPN